MRLIHLKLYSLPLPRGSGTECRGGQGPLGRFSDGAAFSLAWGLSALSEVEGNPGLRKGDSIELAFLRILLAMGLSP